VNLCQEYEGPQKTYKKLGIQELCLPTFDHFTPSVSTLEQAVDFLRQAEEQGDRVYVHCRAGHGRSAAAVYCWLLSKDPTVDREELNKKLCQKRDVKRNLWKQPNIIEFHKRLLDKQD
jgi:atypical dual specificity phosphatase